MLQWTQFTSSWGLKDEDSMLEKSLFPTPKFVVRSYEAIEVVDDSCPV